MKEIFHEYFNFKKVPDYDYDYADFLKWTEPIHPNISRLIKIYGNPYEPHQKDIVELIKKDEMPKNMKKPGGTCELKIEMRDGPMAGEIVYKKILLSWSISNVKNLFSKTLKIPIKNQKISFKSH